VGSGVLSRQCFEVAGEFSAFTLRDDRIETEIPSCLPADLLCIEIVGVPDLTVPVKTAERDELVVDE